MKLQNLFLTLCFLIGMGTTLTAQRRVCGTMEHLELLQQIAPELSIKMEEIERHTHAHSNSNERVDGVITIPVVVHVVWNTSVQNISDAQILSGINVLNEDFRRTNPSAVDTPADFLDVAADVEIEFCLATTAPDGAPTTGITRTQTNETFFLDDEAQTIKSTALGGKDAWPTGQYLNIWVCNLEGNLLGYGQFPGGAEHTDGVVMRYTAIGNIGPVEPPFDLGHVLTHEVGHWLNLRHIWGDGDCSVDDFVDDTPVAANSNETDTPCTYPGPNSCDEGPGDLPDMFQNYMDYSADICLNLFTLGQKARMRALFNEGGFRASLLTSPGCNTPPTCNDGMQNGDETGVDCGGSSCAPCGPAGCTDTNAYNYDPEAVVDDGSCETCSDGILNGDETGVDCGGASCTSDCTLPPGWAATGINCSENGEAHYNNATGTFDLSVENCHNPVFYSSSDFQEFVHQTHCGDGEIIAYIKAINGNAWAGITLRESNNSGAKMIQLAINNSGLLQRKLRLTTGGIAFTSVTQNQGNQWLRLSRTGNQFRAYTSLDGVNWMVALQTSLQMGSCIEAGLFLTNTAPNTIASAQFGAVQIFGGVSMSNGQIHHPNTAFDIQVYAPDFVVYPNPTNGALNLQLDDFLGQPLQLQIFNQQGQLIVSRSYKENHSATEKLQLQHLENGLYLIQLKSSDYIVTKKVNIIQ